MAMNIYNDGEIEKIREAGKILVVTLERLVKEAKPGVVLSDLDGLAEKAIREAGAKPAFLGYRPQGAKIGYPSSICASINDVIVHGIPGPYRLKKGDILTIDLGVLLEGYYADSARSIAIGKVSREAKKLLAVTEKSLYKAIKEARPGKTLGDIGYAVKHCATRAGFQVIKGLTGHGIGRNLHEAPSVFNEGIQGEGLELKAGMVLAIEPMVAVSTSTMKEKKDGSFVTSDGSLSAHFEHTVAITQKGPEILT
jgi:methionyl aminopeptidase